MFEISLIGKKIKKIRKQKKISQEKLAEMISMNHRSIVRIENAQVVPTLETLGKIAEVLDVKIADFFDEYTRHIVYEMAQNFYVNNIDPEKIQRIFALSAEELAEFIIPQNYEQM